MSTPSDVTPETCNPFDFYNIKECQKYVTRIQQRLDKAVANDNQSNIRYYSYLLGKRSRAVKTLAVYKVCYVNDGRHTPGIDGVSISTDKEVRDGQTLNLLKNVNVKSVPSAVRRVLIPKPNGKDRPLGIPTLRDRINQEIIRMSIEPICEYHYMPCSYGFRPKRSCHDAIRDIFGKLSKKNSKRWIIEGDIKGCFDNIEHPHILETLTSWKVSNWLIHLIGKILTAGNIKKGTPQGGIISPMLANVALTCLDQKLNTLNKDKMNPIVRYADDFIIVAKEETEAITIKRDVKYFLKEHIGLELSEEKTNITEISKGFDFLGFNIRKYDESLLIKPAKENAKGFRKEIKETISTCLNFTAESLISKLNPIVTGWGNFYRHVVSKDTYTKLDNYMFDRMFRWIKRKHITRSKKWLTKRYYKTVKDDKWNFSDRDSTLLKMARIPIKRFIKVRSDVRVYNMKDKEYWEKREFVNARDSIYNSFELTKLFRNQKGKCEFCERVITSKDIQSHNIHKHHMQPKTDSRQVS